MGVKKCSRRGCDNLMCQTYVDRIGYVCRECQMEFKNSPVYSMKGDKVDDTQIEMFLYSFMQTYKGRYNTSDIIDRYFERHTEL